MLAEDAFQAIAVIDLMAGAVVHARRGDRAHYRPIQSQLCDSARIEDVIAALRSLFAFQTFYLADLDALQGGEPQWRALEAARQAVGNAALWIDAGVKDAAGAAAIARLGVPIVASESVDAMAAEAIWQSGPLAVLSLDHRDGQFVGDDRLWQSSANWPRDVILIDLARVGSSRGPDLQRLAAVQRVAPQARLYWGGGVSNADELRCLSDAGAAGALLASTLHDGRIGRSDLERISSRLRVVR